MTVNCPHCIDAGWGIRRSAGSAPPVTVFRMPDNSVHAAPDMWLAGRALRLERELGLNGVDAMWLAMANYAAICAAVNASRISA